MCTRIERNSFKRYGGLFAALFAELFQRFTAQTIQNGNGQCGFFIGVDLHRFAQIRRAAGLAYRLQRGCFGNGLRFGPLRRGAVHARAECAVRHEQLRFLPYVYA